MRAQPRPEGGQGPSLSGRLRVLLPALLVPGLPTLGVLALAWLPVERYWILGYEGLGLFRIWPWLLLAAAAWIPLAGGVLHARQGRPLHLPWGATLATLTLLAVTLRLAMTWSLEWRAGLVWLSLLPLAGIGLALALGQVALGEVWRRTCNRAVVRTVTRRLGGGRLPTLRVVPERSRYARVRPWGSPHRLAILDSNYKLNLARVHSVDSPHPPEEEDLRRFFRAGGALVECLLRRWPGQDGRLPRILGVPDRAERRELNTRILLDMIAVGLERLRPENSPEQDALAAELREVLPQWLEALEVLSAPPSPGLPLLRLLIQAGLDGSAARRERIAGFIGEARSLRSATGNSPAEGVALARCCPAFWLLVAPDSMRGELVGDVWRELSGSLPPEAGESALPPACRILQTRHLWYLIDRRLACLPPSQRSGLELRKIPLQETASALQEQVDRLLAEHGEAGHPGEVAARAGAGIPSWPYWEVRRTPAVRRLVGALATLVFGPALLALWFSNPHVSPLKANTIDHIQDPRWYRPLLAGDWIDLAHSGSWLALASREGDLTLFNTRSRLSREAGLQSPAREVAGGMEPGSFLAITRGQGVEEVFPGAGPLGSRVDLETWLAEPEEWGWPGPGGFDTRAVLDNLLDEKGWFVAVRGRGLARYGFRTGPDGRRLRSRSWQFGSSPELDLDRVALTRRGAWYSEREGGVGFVDLETLEAVGRRGLSTPPLRRLDASFEQDWASATDTRDGLWLFEPAQEVWAGPYFGHGDRQATLRSLDSVRAARLEGDLAWLGGREGLFAYDLVGRRIQSVVPGFPSTALEPRTGPEADRSPAVLAAGPSGLIRATTRPDSQDFQIRRLDSEPVTSLALAPGASTAAWRTGKQALRVLRAPFGDGRPETWIPETGGPELSETPTVLDARRAKDGLLLLTRAGAIYYEGKTHTYRDASRTRIPAVPSRRQTERIETLRSLDDVDVTEGRLAILGDGRPHLLAEEAPGEAPLWAALDPLKLGRPVQIGQAGGRVFGLAADGRLLGYQEAEVRTIPESPAGLPRIRSSRFQVPGDLLERKDQTWRISFVHEDRLYSYDSKSGKSGSEALKSPVRGRVGQVRLIGEEPYLLADQRVFKAPGEPLFGFGSLPFPPGQVSALSPGPDWQTILVGGPGGQVLQYRWNDASWTRVGEGPLPAARPQEAVEEILQTPNLVLARMARQVFRATAEGWAALPDCRRAAFPVAGGSGWGLFADGLRRLDSRSARPEGPTCGAGLADPRPPGGWLAAWEEESRLVLFSGEGSHATYHAETDSWRSGSLPGLKGLEGFASWGGGMMVLQGKTLHRILRDQESGQLRSEPFATMPEAARNPALASNGSVLRLAFLLEGDVVVREWEAPGRRPVEFRRSRNLVPDGFDPAGVVVAAPAGRGVLLFDERGACVSHDPLRGRWGRLREARPGQKVFAWVSAPRPALVLQTQENQTHTLRILPDLTLSERVYELPPEKVLERLEWEGCTWEAPGEGTLLETRRLRVTRRQGRTSYEAGLGGEWMPLHLTAGGFAEDEPTRVILSPGASPWALAGRRLFQLVPDQASGGLAFSGRALPDPVQAVATLGQVEVRTLGPQGTTRWTESEPGGALQPIPADSRIPLLRSEILGRQVDWILDPAQTGIPARAAVVPWRQDGRPVAFTGNGRLDFQEIRDLALTDGRVLLATPEGILVRDAETFAFQEWQAGPATRALLRVFGPERVLVHLADGRVVAWEAGGLGTEDLRATPSGTSRIETGAIHWNLASPGAPQKDQGLTLTLRDSPVGWTPHQGGWRPEMDQVRRLDRLEAAERALVLGTRAGSWRLDPDNLRAFEPVEEVEPHRLQGGHAALEILAEAPTLTLRAPDGGPVFDQGRFYFDVSGGLRGLGSSLYTLVAGRGLVGRDSSDPHRIVGYWPLDRQMPDSRGALSAEEGRLALAFQSATPSQRTRWWLDPQEGAHWERDPNPTRPERVEYGPITWRGWRDGRSGFQAIVSRDGREEALGPWWSRDRFAWDDVRSVGVLDPGTVVGLTPVGLVQWTGDSGSFLEAELIPQPGLERLLPARLQGRSAGLLAAGSSGLFLLRAADSGRPARLEAPPAGLEILPGLELIRDPDPALPRITLVERWRRGDPTRLSQEPALRSSIPELRGAQLLQDGQFVFDQGEAACPAGPGPLWAVHAPAGPRSLVTLNRLEDSGGQERPRLVMTGILPAPARFSTMRSHPEGFLAREIRGGWWLARVSGSEIVWSRLESGERIPELRTGDQVVLDVARLAWSATPRYLGDPGEALSVNPRGYPLFATLDERTVLAFDALTSISTFPATRTLALGTLGGVYTVPFTGNGEGVLNLQEPRTAFDFRWQGSEGATPDWLEGVGQLRHDLDGTLYALLGQGLEVARQKPDGTWVGAERMPEDEIRGIRHRISILGGRVLLDERALVSSNDLPAGRRDLKEIVGVAYDPEDNALWLASRTEGLFKLVLDRLLD